MSRYTHTFPPQQQYDESTSVSDYHEYGLDLFGRRIFFGRGLHEEEFLSLNAVDRFVRNISTLMCHSTDTIELHVALPNKMHVNDELTAFDWVAACPNKVVAIGSGELGESALLVMQAADYRVLMPRSVLRLPNVNPNAEGLLAAQHKAVFDILLSRLRDGEKFRDDPEKSVWWLNNEIRNRQPREFLAEEAVHLGLADRVIGKDGVFDWAKILSD